MLLGALEQVGNELTGWEKRRIRSLFHSEMLRYFGCLMLSGKIRCVAEEIVNQYKENKSVVVTIQHTGESGFIDNSSPHSILE